MYIYNALYFQVNCVWTLGNLAASSPKTCELLMSQGALAKMSYIHTNTELQEACLYALKHFVYKLANNLKYVLYPLDKIFLSPFLCLQYHY